MTYFTKILSTFVLCMCVTHVLGECETMKSGVDVKSFPDLNAWWGPNDTKSEQNTEIRKFKVKFSKQMIKDLRRRINGRRWVTPPLEGIAFEYGFNSKQLEPWMNYWANEYNFTEREQYINQYPQYKTNIQGLDIHFVWKKPTVSADVEVVPLLLLHGWPGCVLEFYKSIAIITAANKNRNYAVEVIVPSLPGFGYSDSAVRPGLGAAEMAVVFRNLMLRLGFKKFYLQGGDFGATIGNNLVTLFPENVLGYHTNLALSFSPEALANWFMGSFSNLQSLVVEPALSGRLYPISKILKNMMTGTGYLHIQATKPDTIGIAMGQSPAGLAAYFLEKFSGERNIKKMDGGLFDIFPKEEIIDSLMFYWATNSFTTSARLYAESANTKAVEKGIYAVSTPVPTWTMHAKWEIWYQSPALLRHKFPNLLNSTVSNESLGHFLSWESPKVFTDDVLKALDAFRSWYPTGDCKTEL